MRTFGGFKSDGEFFYGEVIGDEVRRLDNPFWISTEPSGLSTKLDRVEIAVPVAPSPEPAAKPARPAAQGSPQDARPKSAAPAGPRSAYCG